jgi:hypothetical protein
MCNETKQNPITLTSHEVLISAFFIRAANVNKKYIFSNYTEILIDNSVIIKHFESQNVISVMFVFFLGGVQ